MPAPWSFSPIFLVILGVGIGAKGGRNFEMFVHIGLGLGNRELGCVERYRFETFPDSPALSLIFA